MTDAGVHHPTRRWWFFALKDRLPLGADGWTVTVHQSACMDESGSVACRDGAPCHAHVVQFRGVPSTDESLSLGISDIAATIDAVNGRAPHDDVSQLPGGFGDHRWVIAVSVVEPDDNPVAFDEAFSLVVDSVTALRNATGVAIPDPSVERVHPMYMMGLQHDGGDVVPGNVVIVDHAPLGPPPPATEQQLEEAQALLLGRLRGNPVEQYRTFSTKARTAAWQDGNYEGAILNAAIACEVLIKTAAWMLTFEASLMATDPTPVAVTSPLKQLKPSQLIGQILQPRLRGNWDSTTEGRPIREWRVAVAQNRNSLLHLGVRASSADAAAATHAMGLLAEHMMDRLAENGKVYPRTAYALVGPNALERRKRLRSVMSSLGGATDTPDDWIASYVAFARARPDDDDQ